MRKNPLMLGIVAIIGLILGSIPAFGQFGGGEELGDYVPELRFSPDLKPMIVPDQEVNLLMQVTLNGKVVDINIGQGGQFSENNGKFYARFGAGFQAAFGFTQKDENGNAVEAKLFTFGLMRPNLAPDKRYEVIRFSSSQKAEQEAIAAEAKAEQEKKE